MKPINKELSNIQLVHIKYYDYTLFDDIHISPFVSEGNKILITFNRKKNEKHKWVDYWNTT